MHRIERSNKGEGRAFYDKHKQAAGASKYLIREGFSDI
jgi:hypothetical protein